MLDTSPELTNYDYELRSERLVRAAYLSERKERLIRALKQVIPRLCPDCRVHMAKVLAELEEFN